MHNTPAPMHLTVRLTDDQIPAFAAALAPVLALELLKANIPTAAPYDPDELIEVETIRRQLGAHKPQGKITHLTFQRRYIDTGLLHYVKGPNRARRYVRLGDWQRLQSETPKPRK